MSSFATQPHDQSTPSILGGEFGQSAEGFPVAGIGDTVLATLPRRVGSPSWPEHGACRDLVAN